MGFISTVGNVLVLLACCTALYGAYLVHKDTSGKCSTADVVLVGAVVLAGIGSTIDLLN